MKLTLLTAAGMAAAAYAVPVPQGGLTPQKDAESSVKDKPTHSSTEPPRTPVTTHIHTKTSSKSSGVAVPTGTGYTAVTLGVHPELSHTHKPWFLTHGPHTHPTSMASTTYIVPSIWGGIGPVVVPTSTPKPPQ